MVIARSTSFVRRVVVAALVWCVLPLALPTMHAQNLNRPLQSSAPLAQQTPQTPVGQTLQISMDQAVAMALETNLGLKSDKLNLGIASQNIATARSAFNPQLTGSFSRNTTDQPPSDFTNAAALVVSSEFVSAGATLQQITPWHGGRYSVQWGGSRSTTSAELSPFNPTLGSRMTLGYTQPLLRGFKIDGNRANLQSNEMQYSITDLNVQQSIVQTEASVKTAYLRLIGAIAAREVANKNMDVAQESARQAKAKIAVGQAAQIDAIQTDANVASNEDNVIFAEAAVSTAEDNLRSLILDPSRSDYWTVHIVPAETDVPVTPRDIDLNGAIKNALANRLDLQAQKRAMEITALNQRLNTDLTKVAVDFAATYVATGTAGTKFTYGTGFPPPVLSQSDRPFTSALGDTFGYAYPNWTLGVQIAYPIGQTAAKAAVARTQIVQQQQETDLHNLELAVTLSVRDAARQVDTNLKRVVATRTAREANERQLEAEERKNEVGLSTTFDVLQKQTILAQSRTIELQAKIAYNQSLIDFERVQKIR
jgi:outer membrane protein